MFALPPMNRGAGSQFPNMNLLGRPGGWDGGGGGYHLPFTGGGNGGSGGWGSMPAPSSPFTGGGNMWPSGGGFGGFPQMPFQGGGNYGHMPFEGGSGNGMGSTALQNALNLVQRPGMAEGGEPPARHPLPSETIKWPLQEHAPSDRRLPSEKIKWPQPHAPEHAHEAPPDRLSPEMHNIRNAREIFSQRSPFEIPSTTHWGSQGPPPLPPPSYSEFPPHRGNPPEVDRFLHGAGELGEAALWTLPAGKVLRVGEEAGATVDVAREIARRVLEDKEAEEKIHELRGRQQRDIDMGSRYTPPKAGGHRRGGKVKGKTRMVSVRAHQRRIGGAVKKALAVAKRGRKAS